MGGSEKANRGAPGIDQGNIRAIVAGGEEGFVAEVEKQLRGKPPTACLLKAGISPNREEVSVPWVYLPSSTSGSDGDPAGERADISRLISTRARMGTGPGEVRWDAHWQCRESLYQGVHSVVEVDLKSCF